MPPSPAILNRYITTFSGSLKAIHLLILILPFVSGRHVEGDPCFTSLGLYSFDVSLQMVYWKENSRDYKRNFDHWISKRKKKPHSIPTRFPLSQYFGSFVFSSSSLFSHTKHTTEDLLMQSYVFISTQTRAHIFAPSGDLFLSYSQLLSLSHSSLGYCPFSFTGSYFVFLQAINALTMPIPLVLPLSQPLCSDPTSYVLVCIPYHPTQSTRQSRK